MTTFQTLVEAVGEDAAVSVRLWLSDIVEKHTLSADGRTISPSCAWLLDAISPHPTPAQRDGSPSHCPQCAVDTDTHNHAAHMLKAEIVRNLSGGTHIDGSITERADG